MPSLLRVFLYPTLHSPALCEAGYFPPPALKPLASYGALAPRVQQGSMHLVLTVAALSFQLWPPERPDAVPPRYAPQNLPAAPLPFGIPPCSGDSVRSFRSSLPPSTDYPSVCCTSFRGKVNDRWFAPARLIEWTKTAAVHRILAKVWRERLRIYQGQHLASLVGEAFDTRSGSMNCGSSRN
jgi:hypothetical protein